MRKKLDAIVDWFWDYYNVSRRLIYNNIIKVIRRFRYLVKILHSNRTYFKKHLQQIERLSYLAGNSRSIVHVIVHIWDRLHLRKKQLVPIKERVYIYIHLIKVNIKIINYSQDTFEIKVGKVNEKFNLSC